MPTSTTLEELYATVEQVLSGALREKGRAVVALSGGSTPKAYLPTIFDMPVDWSHVTLILVDERWVSPESADSNENLIQTLRRGTRAEDARFLSLWSYGSDPQSAAKAASEYAISSALDIDVVLLGMGGDGHIASLFPGDASLDSNAPYWIDVDAPEEPNVPLPRLSLSPAALQKASHICLVFSGKEKLTLLQSAKETHDLPVNLVLRHPRMAICYLD